ncbi:alpha/beta hydrolase family protein [Alkalihalobacillus sp. R86527]|uniref:alpha/beta hydrolase family protein n=1 Tax=Alkalihalobacillus sp. R86527 TaxID=3093863 RepID=UPI00366A7A6B
MRRVVQDTLHYYYIEPADVIRPQTIIIYHGFGSAAVGSVDLAETFAKEGFSVVIPELIFHDSRMPFTNHFQPEIMQTYFWKTIFQSIEEFPSLVATIGLRKENVILLGSSMGGFIASGIASREANLAGLVNVNGSGSFVFSETLFRDKDDRGAIPGELLAAFKKFDPVELGRGIPPTLLLHGECDEIVSIQGQKAYYRYLAEERDHVIFKSYPNIGHQFTDAMVRDVIEWLHQNFLSVKANP